MESNSTDLVSISTAKLVFAAVPLVALAWTSYYLDFGLTNEILTGTVRSFIQLNILGFILHPIFTWGQEYPIIVLLYTSLMILIASYEACARTKYTFSGIYAKTLFSMFLSVLVVSIFAFYFIIQPTPRLSPQYVIPIVGMLLGNCLNGVSLSLNSITTSLVEKRDEIELYLSFGASSTEAVARLLREAVKAGTMPTLNTMAVIGIISIPGMMTGQILGGASVLDAARYQILILYLIALCSFLSILLNVFMVLRVAFGGLEMLQPNIFHKRETNSSVLNIVKDLFTNVRKSSTSGIDAEQSRPLKEAVEDSYNTMKSVRAPELSTVSSNSSAPIKLVLKDVTVSVRSKSGDTKVLCQNVSHEIRGGDVILLEGPSGSGKSQLLRSMAALREIDSGTILCDGIPKERFSSLSDYRKRVRYVAQTKMLIPGTSEALIDQIVSFRCWKDVTNADVVKQSVIENMSLWGLGATLLKNEIGSLSGGEAQRILLAIALSLEYGVLLLDESTSALDHETKMKVEERVQELTMSMGSAVVWISHDQDQRFRIEELVPL